MKASEKFEILYNHVTSIPNLVEIIVMPPI